MRIEGRDSKECLERGMGVSAASCSITDGIEHEQRQERRDSNVLNNRLALFHCIECSVLF